MTASWWYLTVGLLLLGMTALGARLHRLPVSTAMIYLVIGVAVGPYGLGLLTWDLVEQAKLLEHITELAVLASLFTVGLQMRRSLTDRTWWLPVRLATITMLLTIGMVALIGVTALQLPLGAAVLLGALLAPTDPVLASDVQIKDEQDHDTVRATLSGEAGLNDGTAFPFVMLGLGLLGLHPEDQAGLAGLWSEGEFDLLTWFGWDLVWAVGAGLLTGGATAWLIGVQILRRRQFQEMALREQAFLSFGMIALTYGLAELVYGYGFLSVFAAGYTLRYLELTMSQQADTPQLADVAPDADASVQLEGVKTPGEAAHYVALSLSQFMSQIEHIFEAFIVVLLGAMLMPRYLTWEVAWLAPVFLLVIRPLAVVIGLWGSSVGSIQRGLTGWFGIRGIGSLYYLSYAITHDLPSALSTRLTSLVLSLVLVSIIVHGTSVTPVMRWYERVKARQSEHPPAEALGNRRHDDV